MDKREAVALTRKHLDDNGLDDWHARVNPRLRSTLGRCRYTPKWIELSVPFIEANDADVVEQVILHEIAHAIVGWGHGHGRLWKAKARELGVRNPASCTEAKVPPRWVGHCPACDRRFERQRLVKRRLSCGPCSGPGKFNPEFEVVFKRADEVNT